MHDLQKVFSHSVAHIFTFCIVSADTHFFYFDGVQFVYYFSFITCDFSSISKKPLSHPTSWRFTSFLLTCRSITHFELIFMYDVREESNLIFSHVDIQWLQRHLLRRLLCHQMVFVPLLKINDHMCMCLFLDFQFYSIYPFVYPKCQYHTSFFLLSLPIHCEIHLGWPLIYLVLSSSPNPLNLFYYLAHTTALKTK